MDKQFCLWSSNALWVTRLMINWKCSCFCGGKTHFMNWACLEAAQLKVNIVSFCMPQCTFRQWREQGDWGSSGRCCLWKDIKIWYYHHFSHLKLVLQKVAFYYSTIFFLLSGEIGRDPLNNIDRSNDQKLPNDDYRVIKKIACLFWTT